MVKPLLFAFGWFFFVLGFVGAFIPVLPTTPFLLLAAFFFSRSSPRFHQWLLAMPIFGAAVIDWNENRVIRPRAKALCASMLMASLFIIWRSSQIALLVQISVSLIIVSVGAFVVTRKSR